MGTGAVQALPGQMRKELARDPGHPARQYLLALVRTYTNVYQIYTACQVATVDLQPV